MGAMSLEAMMTPPDFNPNPSPQPPASRDAPTIKTAANTPVVPASNSLVQTRIERPYAPVLPPGKHSHPLETVQGLVVLASGGQKELSPASTLTANFSAINVTTSHDGPQDSCIRTSSEHANPRGKPYRSICSNDSSPISLQSVSSLEGILHTNGSSSRRRRHRSSSAGAEPPRGQHRPYNGGILKGDSVMPDATQSPRTDSSQNHPHRPQQAACHEPCYSPATSKSHSPTLDIPKRHLDSQRPHLPPPHQTLSPPPQHSFVQYFGQPHVPRLSNPRQPRTYTAERDGFKVLRGAVRGSMAQAAANILDQGMEEVSTSPIHKSFGLSLQAYTVRDQFMRNASHQGLRDFYTAPRDAVPAPLATQVSEWLPTTNDQHARYATVQTADSNVLYVTVALTTLDVNNGLFTILGGSHKYKDPRFTPMNLWDRIELVLNPGDALVWRGDLKYLFSLHGGGRFMTMVFRLKDPKKEEPVVDLTKHE